MAGAAFDPTHAVRFDLRHGSVTVAHGERQLLVSCAALDDLVLVAGAEAAIAVGRSLGGSLGRRVADRLGGPLAVIASSLETAVAHLGGEIALSGLGVLALERWGSALVAAVERPGVRDLSFLAAILEGAIEAASGRAVRCASLGRERGVARVLVSSERAVTRARAWLGEGLSWGEVLARLQPHGGGA